MSAQKPTADKLMEQIGDLAGSPDSGEVLNESAMLTKFKRLYNTIPKKYRERPMDQATGVILVNLLLDIRRELEKSGNFT